jgi:hypothetical protein
MAQMTNLRRPVGNADTEASSLVNPTSSLLQDLIKEQRATRGPRKVTLEAPDDGSSTPPPTSQSHEETPSEVQRRVNNALSAGLKPAREMGMREMDQVSPGQGGVPEYRSF